MTQAEEKARVYEWTAAAELYKQALASIDSDDPIGAGRVSNLLANAYYKAAFQSKTREEFITKAEASRALYEEASALFRKAGFQALSNRTQARALFINFWLTEQPNERRQALKECIDLAEEAIKTLEKQGNNQELAETYADLLTYLLESIPMTSEWNSFKQQVERSLEIGEKAAALPEEVSGETLLESLYKTAHTLAIFWEHVLSSPAAEKRGKDLTQRISELAGRLGTPYAATIAHVIPIWLEFGFGRDPARAMSLAEACVSEAAQSRDLYLIGLTASLVVGLGKRAELAEEDSQRKMELIEKALKNAQVAIESFRIPYYGTMLTWAYMQKVLLLTDLALSVETDPGKKMELLRKAVDVGREGMVYKNHNPGTEASHGLSRALLFLATMVADPIEKMRLLKEARRLREEILQEWQVMGPSSYDMGTEFSELALVKAELSNIEQDPQTEIQLLQGAASDMQRCLDIWSKLTENPSRTAILARTEEAYGDILLKLHSLTTAAGDARNATRQYEASITSLTKLGFTASVPAVRWKLAKALDELGEYKRAADMFKSAATDFRASAKKTLASANTFEQLGSYMDAWGEIEQARLHHDGEQYLSAAAAYLKAAQTLRATNAWNHLGGHYEACYLLETGEALSRQEKPEAAFESFTQATKAFNGAKLQMETSLKERQGSSESKELADWLRITEGRIEYSLGRAELEEAKVLDKNGDEEGSARKYRSASDIFQALLAHATNPQDRGEMETLMLYCKAWARMKEAETEASPEHYNEAAEFFLKAREASVKKRFRLLAQANASICRALEAGARFRQTQNTQLYSDIKKQLQSAADHYQEAGVENAARWTRATQRLFDALAYLANAETEIDSKKKTELYLLAEKYMELAARLYGEAGFTTKKEEVLKHLARVREDKELLLTPAQALAENPALTGSPVAPVSLVRDQALGLERFEVANVVGNLIVPQRVLSVGSELTLELELANVGKTAATLIKLENLVPEGLELDREKIPHRVEDNYIDMKGKRLEYLKTHEVKVTLRAARKGAFELRPRLLFVDEKGNYRSYDFEPRALAISELGISGWLKGPK